MFSIIKTNIAYTGYTMKCLRKEWPTYWGKQVIVLDECQIITRIEIQSFSKQRLLVMCDLLFAYQQGFILRNWKIIKFFFCLHVYFWERKRNGGRGRERRDGEIERERGGAGREGDTESKAGTRLRAVSTELDAGLEPTSREIMTWTKVRCLPHWANQVSLENIFRKVLAV